MDRTRRPTRADIEMAKSIIRSTPPDVDADEAVDLDRLPEAQAAAIENRVEDCYKRAAPHLRKLWQGDYSQITAIKFVVRPDGQPASTVVYYYAIEGDAQIASHPEAPGTPLLVYPDGRAVQRVVEVPLCYHHLFEQLCEHRLFNAVGHA